MRTRLFPVLLLLVAPFVSAQQSFDAVVTGGENFGACFILPITQPVLQWYSPSSISNQDFTTIASGDGRRVLAVSPGTPLRIVEIFPDGSQSPFYEGSPGFGMSMAVASNGRVFVAAGGVTPSLVRISPTGTLEATYPLTTDEIALGPDGCTIYYRSNSSDIGRINGCTGEALPDFATLTWISDIAVLPDGQVLVSFETQIDLYDASGGFVRTVANLPAYGLTERGAQAIAVRNGVLYIAAVDPCNSSESVLLGVALSNGEEVSRRSLAMTGADAIVLAASGPTVPTLGEMALVLLAFVLAAGGALMLKLR